MQYQKKILVLIFVLCLCGVTAAAQTPKKPNEIAREQSKAVVVIEALDERGSIIGQGSGFIVTPNGAVVSNLHVVRGAASLRVKLPSGDAYKTADLVDVDEAKDIVIIKIKGFKLPSVTLGDSDKVETGDAIVAISSPEGLTNSLSTGVISGVRRMEAHRVFQITAPISRGSSGGALFNANGEIIGIVTSLLKSGQNINFAVPINYARGMIGDQVSTSLARLQPPSTKKEVENKSADIYDTDEAIHMSNSLVHVLLKDWQHCQEKGGQGQGRGQDLGDECNVQAGGLVHVRGRGGGQAQLRGRFLILV